MSYAVIQTGGKQYKVKSGEILKIEKLPDSKVDTKIEFKEILAYGDDKIIEVGSPIVTGAKVEADIVKNGTPTLPTTLEDELKCNIFLRANDVKNFSKLRDLKDNF